MFKVGDDFCYYAKDFVSKSARQLKRLSTLSEEQLKEERKPNDNMKKGNLFQNSVAKEYPGSYQELGSYLNFGNCRVYFSIDIVTNRFVIEVKSIDEDRPVNKWYFTNSLLQCAIYKSLIIYGANRLRTSWFARQELGYPYVVKEVPRDIQYLLRFGDKIYTVDVTDPKPFIKFIHDKLQASLDWDDAAAFDKKYKFKEFEILGKYINYAPVVEMVDTLH